jgi:hypothetical protein
MLGLDNYAMVTDKRMDRSLGWSDPLAAQIDVATRNRALFCSPSDAIKLFEHDDPIAARNERRRSR